MISSLNKSSIVALKKANEEGFSESVSKQVPPTQFTWKFNVEIKNNNKKKSNVVKWHWSVK